jgi:hypothetical protein
MKELVAKILDARYAVPAAITVALMGTSANAASKNVGDTAKDLGDQMGAVGKLLVAGSFVGGIVMLASGLMKLKQAAETQGQQVKYGEGMWRVAVGAGLIAIPAFGGMLTTTFFGSNVTMSERGDVSF